MNKNRLKGFIWGLLYSLLKQKRLAQDANTNNPDWVTTKEGHHYLIDKYGTIKSGRFKGLPIDELKTHWKHPNKKTKHISGQRLNNTEFLYDYGKQLKTDKKGIDALNLLNTTGKGHIKGAWHREQIGPIDIAWGDSLSFGWSHILHRRLPDGSYSRKELLADIDNTVANGDIYKLNRSDAGGDRFAIVRDDGFCVFIGRNFKDQQAVNTVITAYKLGKGELKTMRKREAIKGINRADGT